MSFETVLAKVIAELQEEDGVQAIFLTGSINRGEADEFSDLDVSVLVKSDAFVRNNVSYRDSVLVSVERSTPEHRAKALSDPETALWNLSSLQTGRALYDPDGIFGELQQKARGVQWADMRPIAGALACARVADSAEELHKVMGGLTRQDDAKIGYTLLGLSYALGIAALLATGTVLPTENRFLTLARDAWPDPGWREAYGVMTGLAPASMRERGLAALHAYTRTVALLPWTDGPDRELANGAAERAAAFPTYPRPVQFPL